ncbi:hypothetical protein CEUSTIGMA_g5207.t1 [Chlamydomonas eustigma]|uniref:Uncharacterized protein n=1 Tax=Chlamydomonas eustigma TaxID=1157962 RepID=A0A250X3V4_9CHLO|nr:hypothetical protein CEUSTIGMA_g5207.t1 [Chlamydomonas eustigma]|eukprot:GAX77764.1 hypothetical protein CEUSTIGMA_g5207.t1 [Chlamydomonas eustigma]
MIFGPGLPEDYDSAHRSAGGDALPSTESHVLKGHDGPVFGVRFNKTGTYCVSCGKDRNIILWNPHTGVRIKTYVGHGYDVRDATISADNSKFASCGGDKQVFLWDVQSGRFIRKFRGHDAVVNAVTYAASDDVLVTAGYDQCVKVWDCKSRSIDPIQVMKVFQDSVTSVAVHTHDIVAGSVDGTVRRFDIRMGRMYTDTLHHPVTSVALSHDGQCVLSACLDSTLRLLDKGSGELLATYQGHVHQAIKLDCCLTPSDAHVVCGSEAGDVLYWDLVDANIVKSFKAHAGVVCSLAMHPNGRTLITSSVDGSIKVWTV